MQQDSSTGAGPGWYPDPSDPSTVRYWDGQAWTGATAPGAGPAESPAPGPETDRGATAAFAISIFGVFPAAIVLAVVARRRIARSDGRLTGKGFTTAALVISAAWAVGIIGFLVLDDLGYFEDRNADDYSGVEHDVAAVIDRFEDGSPDEICEDVLTEELRVSYRGFGGPDHCADRVAEDDDREETEYDVVAIDVDGDTATVEAAVRDARLFPRRTFTLVRQGGEWRIDGVRSS